MRHFATDQAKRTAALHAQFVASSMLADRVEVTDFTDPIDAERQDELDDQFRRLVLNNSSTVLAELVAWDELDSVGCTYAQGYFISKTISIEEFEQLMQEARWDTRQVHETADEPHHSLAEPAVTA